MNPRARRILWLDAGAGGTVGLLLLTLRDWLVHFYQLSFALLTFIAAANLAYASYSFLLAALASLKRTPSRRAIDLLVFANLTWSVVCAVMFVAIFQQASPFGLAHVAFEGLFVGALAVIEYRQVRPHAR